MKLKLFCITIMMWLVLYHPAGAMSPIDVDMIKEAQEYGKNHINSPLKEFLQPWTSVEVKSDPAGETVETACLYTPFLLTAADARDKIINGGSVSTLDSEKILSDYAGYLTFSVLLYGADPQFAQDSSAILTQGGKIIKAVQVRIPPATQRTIYSTDTYPFVAQGYLYFQDTDILLDQTVLITVYSGDKREHRYELDLAKIR